MLECTYDPKLSFDNVKITVCYPASAECMVIEREMILDGDPPQGQCSLSRCICNFTILSGNEDITERMCIVFQLLAFYSLKSYYWVSFHHHLARGQNPLSGCICKCCEKDAIRNGRHYWEILCLLQPLWMCWKNLSNRLNQFTKGWGTPFCR